MIHLPASLKIFFISLGFCLSLLADDPFYFIIRVDDIQSRINWSPRSIIPFQTAVESRSAKVSWAVIPHRLQESQNGDGVLRNELLGSIANGHEIIQHGYNHICPNCGQSSHEMYCSQFGVAHEDSIQVGLVQSGFNILQDSLNYTPTCFVPPGHVADFQTYAILIDQGFEFLSTIDPLYSNDNPDFFNLAPQQEYTWSLSASNYVEMLQQALENIENAFTTENYYCLLLHDPFIREGYENGLVIDWTVELLDSLNSIYPSRIQYATLSDVARIMSDQQINNSDREVVPAKFSLIQNFPNPFNPITTISYNLPEQSMINVSVLDIRGQKVTNLNNGIKQPGKYEVQWNGMDQAGNQVSTGVYFCRLEAGKFSQTIKMLFLK